MTPGAKCWIICAQPLQLLRELCVASTGRSSPPHPSCVHLLLPVVREQKRMMYGSWADMRDGWELSYGAWLGDSHLTGAGIDWLELSRPSRFISGQQPALCPLGAPVERELLARSEKLGISVVVYHVLSSQRQRPSTLETK